MVVRQDELVDEIENEKTLYLMAFAHGITAIESFLSDY